MSCLDFARESGTAAKAVIGVDSGIFVMGNLVMNMGERIFGTIRLFLIFAVLSMTIGCGSKAIPPEPDWVFKPESIEVSYQADVMLNEFKGASHALQVVIYQMDNVNKFSELAGYKDGIKMLLKAQNFDASVHAVKKIFVDPGEVKKIVLDRSEKARWVGIAAGYFTLEPGRATCFFEIPHKIEKKGMFFFRKDVAVISDPKFNLLLKEHDMQGVLLNE